MPSLANYTSAIAKIFADEQDRAIAHKKSQPILAQMANDKPIIFEIIKKNLLKPDFINKVRHYPTLAFEIYLDSNIGMNANVFMPLPDKSTDISFQSIHHHGKLLLSTAAAEGPGYESILFKKGFTINPETKETNLQIEKIYTFGKGGVDFVGSDQPHVVFFPADVSITYTIWAYEKTVAATASLKNNFLIKKFKEPIRAIIKALGLTKQLGVNAVEYFDFYPEGSVVKAIKNRIEFTEGDNENFLANIFYVMQKVGFADFVFLTDLKKTHPSHIFLHTMVDKYIAREAMSNPFYDFHKNVAKVNLSKREILAAVQH
jgi:hypothetical protein